MIPDGTGNTMRSRTAAVVSGTSQIVLADAAGYFGYGSLDASNYILYVYAIYSAADAGIVWAVSANPNLRMVATTATATDFSYMLLEGSSTYSKQATDYCVRVGSFKVQYDTADAPDYTIDAANIYVGWNKTPIDNDFMIYKPVVTASGGTGNTIPVYSAYTGAFQIVGQKCLVYNILSGDGGDEGAGTGGLVISTPIAISATHARRRVPCGTASNSTTFFLLCCDTNPSTSIVYLFYFNAINTIADFLLSHQNNTGRSLYISYDFQI
jgi:hypothetical protein